MNHRYPLGSKEPSKKRFKLVCASNRELSQLSIMLASDFMDRINRLIVIVPPLRECREDLPEYWKAVWRAEVSLEMFENKPPFSEELTDYFQHSPLNGNFRDLVRLVSHIEIFYGKYKNWEEAIKASFEELAYYEILSDKKPGNGLFKYAESADKMQKRFNFLLAQWAVKEYGGKKEASEAIDKTVDCINKWLRIEV